MESNPSGQDPRAIWQKQPGETSKVSIILIHKMARESRAKTRKELIAAAWVHVAFAILASVGMVKGIGWPPSWPQRAWYAAALLWCIVGAWVLQRGMWTAPLAGDAGLETGIAFLRREIQRRRDLFGRGILWALCPIIFTLAAAIVPALWNFASTNPKALRNTIPFFTLLAGWAIAMVVVRIRKKRELQRELDDLDEIEKERRS